MRIRRIRFREEYRFRGRLIIASLILLSIILIPASNRALMASFFSKRCRNHQAAYSKKLNDRLLDYKTAARQSGIEICVNEKDLAGRILAMQLFRIRNTRDYKIAGLTHSYPYLTRDSKKLLKEIGRRFRKKMNSEGLKGSKFVITSMTRTSEKLRGLGVSNGNASENSPHLNGNAFDISYANFSIFKYRVTECDKWFMKEALAEVIYELRKEKKCWATYERQQGCFHVVARGM